VFDLAARRKINQGFSDGFTRAVEIVATPVLLGFLGSLLDGWLGTRPAFTLALAALGVAGIGVKLWLGYDREMREEEAKVPSRRSARRVVSPPPADLDMALDPGIGASPGTGDRTQGGEAGA
jgi:F0F1-type ATP synthase assembly protein I